MRESKIEKYLKQRVEAMGGECFKFSSPSNRAVPDRICFFKTGIIILVECKASGNASGNASGPQLSKLQSKMRNRLAKCDTHVFKVASRRDVNNFISYMEELINGNDNTQ